MPLYKNQSLKPPSKTQNSFISPLSNPDKIKKSSNDQKSKPLTSIERSATNENTTEKNLKSKSSEKHEEGLLSLLYDFEPEINTSNLTQNSEKSISTKIEINSDNDVSERSQSTISEMLNECVITNIRLSQQLFDSQEMNDTLNSTISIMLDDCVQTNLKLSQQLFGTPETFNEKNSQNTDTELDQSRSTKEHKNESKTRKRNTINDQEVTCSKTPIKKTKLDDDNLEKHDGERLKRNPPKCQENGDEASNVTIKHSGKKNDTKFKSKTKNHNCVSKNKEIEDLYDAMLKLQEKRNVGLYVYCDTCDKVRYLPDCKDPLELPDKWYCHMNPDSKFNKCTDPEEPISTETQELLIENKFNAGSIVWAKMKGYPWMPAMVDDDPDLEDYFWLDNEDSIKPSWYHVTFFYSLQRAWIKTENLEPFQENENKKFLSQTLTKYFKGKVKFSIDQAKKASKLEILERLREFSFLARYLKTKKRYQRQKKKINKFNSKAFIKG